MMATTNSRPLRLIKKRMKAISTRGLEWFHIKKGLSDLLEGDRLVKCSDTVVGELRKSSCQEGDRRGRIVQREEIPKVPQGQC